MKEYVGYPYAVATNTGTAALHLALLAGSPYSDVKIQIPPICFRAVWNAVKQIALVPVFQEAHCAIDVMNYGFPTEKNHGQILDASEGLGGDIPRNYQYVTLSFNWNKPVTCGSGGMVLCRDKYTEWRMRLWANQCKFEPIYFIHAESIGFNYRMNDLQATMGMQYLAALAANTVKRKAIYLRYLKAGLPVVKPPRGFRWNYWITLLRTPRRDKVLQAFQANGIEARAMFTPHTREFPKINKFAAETMCLPSSPGLSKHDQNFVIKIVKENL